MKISILIIMGCFLLVFTNCDNNTAYSFPDFEEIRVVKGDTIIKDILCTDIWRMEVVDSLLILQCLNSIDKKQFYIYNHKNGLLLATFGEKGNGPGELPRSFDMSLDRKNRIIYTFGDKKNISYSIDSIILRKNYYNFRKQVELNTSRSARKISYLDNNKFYAIGYRQVGEDARIAILNEFNDILVSYEEKPVISDIDKSDSLYRELFYFYKSAVTLKPDATKLAYATTCGLHLEIFRLSENEILKEQFHRYITPKYIKKNPIVNDGIIEGCTYLFASDNYIYAKWSDDTQQNPGKKIALFDWQGIPKYMLNIGRSIGYAAVTADDSDLFLEIQDEAGRINIVKYKLNTFLP